jgi:hypothetical protein
MMRILWAMAGEGPPGKVLPSVLLLGSSVRAPEVRVCSPIRGATETGDAFDARRVFMGIRRRSGREISRDLRVRVAVGRSAHNRFPHRQKTATRP